MTAPYTRATRKARNTQDDEGTVVVYVTLRDRAASRPTGAKKGNVTRCITVHEARVSDVAKIIENALFGPDGQ